METVILYASLPLPISINKMYYTDSGGRRRKSEEAVEWSTLVFDYLDNGQAEDPEVVYLNVTAIQALRELYQKKKTKATEALKGYYEFEVFYVFPTEASDVDGCTKLAMDTVTDWLREKREDYTPNSFNDNRVISLPARKIVTKAVRPHVEFGLRECHAVWESGCLIERYRQLTKVLA